MASALYASSPSPAPYASSPSPAPYPTVYQTIENLKTVLLSFNNILGSYFTQAADLLTLACLGVFTFLIVFDVWQALRKRAPWLPGKAFGLCQNTFNDQYFQGSGYVYISAYSPLFSFIIIGWVVICWRWLAVQLYCPHRGSWRRGLYLEDFWTSHTVELIDKYDLKKERHLFHDGERSLSEMPTKIFTKVRLHKLLYLVLRLQLCVVYFSKLCGLLSQVIVGNFVYWYRKHMRKEDPIAAPEIYAKILECLCMPGEDPSCLWEANKMSFIKAKLIMGKGCTKGRSSEEINSIFHLYSPQWAKDGGQLLDML